MQETRYLISEASKLTETEPHVLRYWEEELDLPIARNELGHRYYTEKDIQTFQCIRALKKQGLQLRAIRDALAEKEKIPERENDVPEESVQRTKEEYFCQIMDRLIHEISGNEKREGRFRKLDEAIRQHQKSRKMVAATEEKSVKRNKKRKIKV